MSIREKLVAKNTIMLYSRMLVLITVNLYTSRVILNSLGVKDFGLYTIVGSIVIFLSFINNSMSMASQRFLSYAKGKKSVNYEKTTFSSLFISHCIISLLIIFLSETVGLYYINHYLNITPEKLGIAKTIFHLSLFTLIIKTTTAPYVASFISNERMSFFAFVSLFEGALQLIAALTIERFNTERLLAYSILMLTSVLICQSFYVLYASITFKECRLTQKWTPDQIREIFSYSGWNLLGAFSSVSVTQGLNMLLNCYFGVAINAARGISTQVSGALASFTNNFQQALNPQIVKCYASNEIEKMHSMIINGARLSYFLLLTLSVPIIFNSKQILTLWLVNPPQYVFILCILEILSGLVNALSGTTLMGVMATGNIKSYQLIVSFINISALPLSYIGLQLIPNPYLASGIIIATSVLALFTRLYMAQSIFKMKVWNFVQPVAKSIIPVTSATLIISYILTQCLGEEDNLILLLIRMSISAISTILIIWFLGVNKNEKALIIKLICSER